MQTFYMKGRPSYGVDPDLLTARLQQYYTEGTSKSRAYKQLAQDFDVSPSTIYRLLEPQYAQRQQKYSKHYYSRMNNRIKRREYLRDYRQKSVVRRHQTQYKQLKRNLWKYLPSLFEGEHEFTAFEICSRLFESNDFRIRGPTIEKLIKKYRLGGKLGDLDEIEPGVYKWKTEV